MTDRTLKEKLAGLAEQLRFLDRQIQWWIDACDQGDADRAANATFLSERGGCVCRLAQEIADECDRRRIASLSEDERLAEAFSEIRFEHSKVTTTYGLRPVDLAAHIQAELTFDGIQ